MKRVLVALSMGASVLLAACGGSSVSTNPSTGAPFTSAPTPPAAQLIGTGATKALGSGAGISQLTKKVVDFGASDVPMNATELTAAGGSDNVVQIASTLGTESLAYNLSGLSNGQLKLTPKTIAGIFLGTIKNWNDPALAADNSGVSLPNQPISVVHRSDGSGTTYIFTDYLSTVSADWKSKVGKSKSVSWPVGQGAKGNEAVATTIKQTPGAIGYVELAYVIQTNMTQASLQNHDGNFVIPSADGATAAASQFLAINPTQFSIVDAPGKDSAPISGYSWLMLYKNQPEKTKGTALVDFLDWLVTDGQQYAVNLHYAKLPANLVKDDIIALKTVTSGGSTLLNVPAPS